MAKKRKFTSVENKCRVCLGDDGCMSDIFSEDLKPKINDLGNSTSIHINNDENLPRNICHICLYKLDMWIEFKKQFLRSNTMLCEHLGVSELSDNTASVTKRKHSELEECPKDNSPKDGAVKKMKSDEPKAIESALVSASRETVKKSPANANCEPLSIEDTSSKNISDNVGRSAEPRGGTENTSSAIPVTSPVKQIIGRRSKTTERRKASTKRWVARKKALLAATGENDTDTDSMSSDEAQLSPVQKARAKCNAEKVVETQKRISKSLKDTDHDIADCYGSQRKSDSYLLDDTDSDLDGNKKLAETAIPRVDPVPVDEKTDSHSAINTVERKNMNLSRSNNKLLRSLANNSADNFLPHSVRSELTVDDATFIVTSTLVLTEPRYLNPVAINNSTLKDPLAAGPDENNQERNTDIIDAVQLRRVCPKTPLQSDKKFVERCLNIEVEGTELEALQRVQSELASFVETELFKVIDSGANELRTIATSKDSFQSLDRQLKTIVEKSIKKNLETSRIDKMSMENRGNNTFTGEFVKAALRSKIFQPRVVLVRFDANRPENLGKIVDRASPARAIDKKSLISSHRQSVGDPSSLTSLGKRRSIQPAKFADYDRSPFNSEEESDGGSGSGGDDDANDVAKNPDPPLGPKCSKVKTYGPALTKQGNVGVASTSSQRDVQKLSEITKRDTPAQSILPSSTEKTLPSSVTKLLAIDENSGSEVVVRPVANNTSGEKHICGVCGEFFGTRREVEIHFSTHKNPIATIIKQAKQKMMRCKRCHEIVEARHVKLHVCNLPKNPHKCYTCEATFRSDKLLVKHLETHSVEENKLKIDALPAIKVEKESDHVASSLKECPKTNYATATSKKLNLSHAGVTQTNDSYTCFVCDKIFEDEEILKDHLQKHCDDISEEEDEHNEKNDKEQFQCAICGESLESEDALESHVEKHLFDDEDDNPNLISIGCNERDKRAVKSEMMTHGCSQCSEIFDSEMLLMLHMQAHEEEVAIAEWERRGADNAREEQHVCVICDDLFTTEAELSEHLDVHNGNAHVCLLCDKPFLTLEELQSHVNTH